MNAQIADNCTIFLALVGSRAYGIHDKNSDYDKKGVLIPPSKYLFGTEIFEQFCDYPGEDKVIFDFKKVVNLIADNNPNMLDLLFSPEKCILTLKRPWEIIIENRDLFLSKRCRHTYSGYAFTQLRKLDDHRRFLLNPPKVKPERKDYGLPDVSIFPTAQLKAVAYAAVREFIVEEDKGNFINELDDAYSTYVMPIFDKFIKPEFRTLALDNLQVGIKAQAHTLRSLGASFIKDEYLEAATKELKFYSAYTEWQQYQAWLKNRNKARAELELKFTYDCYLDDTEFLTDQGWKKYDDIDHNMKLATVKTNNIGYKLSTKKLIGKGYRAKCSVPTFGIEYQPYIDRFEGIYSGKMYNFIGNHMDIMVTPNHRMLFRSVGKNNGVVGDFLLEEAAILPNCFDFLRTITPVKRVRRNPVGLTNLPISDLEYLSLMGWYLSEGCFTKKRGKITGLDDLRISQKKGGRLSSYLMNFYEQLKDTIRCRIYCYKRKPNAYNPQEIEEMLLVVREKSIVERIYKDCNSLKEKRIPRWAFNMSKRLMDTLLNALCLGDGTVRNTSLKSWIYYSSLKNLADDVQELALCCGYETSLYGPYEEERDGCIISMYQVHINKNVSQFDRLERTRNLNKVDVVNKRIVCFTVLNRTLITRRNGHVAFQGNSKHAAHMVRLIRMCKEILETGKVNVDRTNIDAEELKAIRYNGIWSYQELVDYARKMDDIAEQLYRSSTLPELPDTYKIKDLYTSICEEHIRSTADKT